MSPRGVSEFRPDAAEVQAQIEAMDARSPANGAAVVARAWVDADFKARLLDDASAASREMGFDIGTLRLIAVENTAQVHNMIVCTLCSCYPRNLLGLPPDWYESRAYRSRTVREPRKVLAEFGVDLGPEVTVRVHDSTADMRYIVLPRRPEGTESLGEADLAALDAVSWKLMQRFDGFATELKVIAKSRPTPALPFVTSGTTPKPSLFEALQTAIGILSERDREILCLQGVKKISAEAYLALPVPEMPA